MTFQSIPIYTIKFIPINNQKTGVNNSFLMPNRIASNNKTITPTNIQKKVVSVVSLSSFFIIIPKTYYEDYPFKTRNKLLLSWPIIIQREMR